MGNITNARSLASGTAFRLADSVTTAPTSLAAAIAACAANTAKSLGEISEDGIKLLVNKEKVEVPNMNGEVVFTINSKHDVKVNVTPLDFLAEQNLAEWAGTSNVTNSGGTVKLKSSDVERAIYIFLVALAGGKMAAVVCPDAGMTSDSIEMVLKASDVVKPALEYTCYPDEDGVKAYIYIGVPSNQQG